MTTLYERSGIDGLNDLLRKLWGINCLYYEDSLTWSIRLQIKNTFAKKKKGNNSGVPTEKWN